MATLVYPVAYSKAFSNTKLSTALVNISRYSASSRSSKIARYALAFFLISAPEKLASHFFINFATATKRVGIDFIFQDNTELDLFIITSYPQ